MEIIKKVFLKMFTSYQTYILLGIFSSLLGALRIYYYYNPQHYVPNEYMRLVWTAVIMLTLFFAVGFFNLYRFYSDSVFRKKIIAKTAIENKEEKRK